MADLTVMITRWTGKTHSFCISSRVLVWFSLLLVFYIIVSLVIIYEYMGLRRTNIERDTQITHLENEIVIMKKDFQGATQQLSLFNNAVHDFQSTRESQTEASKAEGLDSKPVQIDAGGNPVEKKSTESKEAFAGIDDFTVHKNGSKMDVRFKVINLRQDKAAISGYVLVIAIDPKSDPPKLWSYPKTTLQNIISVNYKEGEPFTISHFKIIEGKYSFESKTEDPSLIKVLVYDKLGNLFLQKEFEVEGIS